MASITKNETNIASADYIQDISRADDEKTVPIEEEAVQEAEHVNLSWRSWVGILLRVQTPAYISNGNSV